MDVPYENVPSTSTIARINPVRSAATGEAKPFPPNPERSSPVQIDVG